MTQEVPQTIQNIFNSQNSKSWTVTKKEVKDIPINLTDDLGNYVRKVTNIADRLIQEIQDEAGAFIPAPETYGANQFEYCGVLFTASYLYVINEAEEITHLRITLETEHYTKPAII